MRAPLCGALRWQLHEAQYKLSIIKLIVIADLFSYVCCQMIANQLATHATFAVDSILPVRTRKLYAELALSLLRTDSHK